MHALLLLSTIPFEWAAAAAPNCVDPAPDQLAECLHAAPPGSVDTVLAAAAAHLDSARAPEAIEALLTAMITSPQHVRTRVADLLTERGLLASATLAVVPTPPEVDRELARALSRVKGWPRTDLRPPTRACAVTGEAEHGVLTLRCTARTCAPGCVALSFDAAFRVDASGWHLQTMGGGAVDDGSCGCCETG